MKKGLLLGAGFSFDLGMPLAKELTEIFLGRFDKQTIVLVGSILSRQNPFSSDRPINASAINTGLELILDYKQDSCCNYEAFLAELEQRSERSSFTQSDRDSYHFLYTYFYGLIREILVLYQHISYDVIYK